MNTYISILRGINVGGKRKIIMKDLCLLHQNLGFTNVRSYIQSGNVVFESKLNSNEQLESIISDAILKKYGFEVPVIVRSKAEWKAIKEANPYLNESIEQLHITFLKDTPPPDNLKFFDAFDAGNDQLQIADKQIYIFCGGAYRETKLTNQLFEKKLQTNASTRNWKTFMKIFQLCED